MRNLVVRNVNVGLFDGEGEVEFVQENTSTGDLFIATKKGIYCRSNNENRLLADWTEFRMEAELIDFQYLFDNDEICAVFANGLVLVLTIESLEFTEAALIDASIEAAHWNADISLLTITDGNLLFFLDRLFDNFSTVELSTSEKAKDELISVGWGSADTQFQGSAGKNAIKNKLQQQDVTLPPDSQRTYLEWKTDCSHLFISRFDKTSCRRLLQVHNNEGELTARIKLEKPMEEKFAVRPVGNYIATTSFNTDGKREIVFFEKNGEKRHEYLLNSSIDETILFMRWNCEATILMIAHRSATHDQLEFWTVSNYNWTRKWTYSTPNRVLGANWSAEKANILHFFTGDGKFFEISFEWEYLTPQANAIVVATDGLRITNLKKRCIPPPMSEYFVSLSVPPICLAENNNILFAILSDGTVCKVNLEDPSGSYVEYPKKLSNFNVLTSLTLVNDDQLYAIRDGKEIVIINPNDGTINCLTTNITDNRLSWLEWNAFIDKLVVSTEDGTFYAISDSGSELLFNVSSNSFSVAITQHGILILTTSGDLYLNKQSIAHSVSSFCVAGDVCLFTTQQNKLVFANLNNSSSDSLYTDRSLEIGSRLVCSIPEGTSIVLQMPRGNLEMIHPRPFIITSLRKLIDNLQYVEALKMMKKHRIDMNILVDHNPETFVNNIKLIFDRNEGDLINLFIAALNSERNEHCNASVLPNKIETITSLICDHVLSLELPQRVELFTVLLSALLKSDPPNTEKALQLIKVHTDLSPANQKTVLTKKWLHYVGFFVDVQTMLKASLATYDLFLAVQVSEACNQDPKEFLPLLNRLRVISPVDYQKYHIDIVREDYAGALAHIAKMPDRFQEATELIQNKGLFRQALSIYRNTEQFGEICRLVATHLETKAQWSEAVILWQKVQSVERILHCHEMARNVTAFIETVNKNNVPVDSVKTRLLKMSIQLKGSSLWSEAAKASLFIGNATEAATLFCKAGEWREATKCLLEKDVEAIRLLAIERYTVLSKETEERKKLFAGYASRLTKVRTSKQQKILNLRDGVDTGRDIEDCDAFSDASTISQMTRRTGKSGSSRASSTASMRKRKQIDRKKQNLKEGGEYEDSALLLALKEQVKWINDISKELLELLPSLLFFDEFDAASHLQKTFTAYRTFVLSQMDHIWPSKLLPHHLCGPLFMIYSVDNVFKFPEDGLMPEVVIIEPEMTKPELSDDQWRIKMLES